MDRLSIELTTAPRSLRGPATLTRFAALSLGVAACSPTEGGREAVAVGASTPSSLAPARCAWGEPSVACGDPCADGVVVSEDVTTNTRWDCPVYTLPAPVFVRGDGVEPTQLVIAPGTRIEGRAGNLEQGQLPGALIVTRSGRVEARGTRDAPIVFTSARPVGQRTPGDWGGVVLLGRAPTNVPANYLGSGNRAGEMFVEGLPPSEDTTYGASVDESPLDAGAAPVEPASAASRPPVVDAGPADAAAVRRAPPDPDHDCGTLRFVRIEFAGFVVGDTNELNGLTVAACGRHTVLDYVQVHLGSDDGIELFGGNADLRHAVITGAQDDALDWDQGWTGRVQFLAIHQRGTDSSSDTDNALEGDGFADPEQSVGEPSRPILSNVTLLSDSRAARSIRLREGTGLELLDAIVAAPGGGPLEGLVDIGDVATADQLAGGRIRIEHSIFQGSWPTRAQADSGGAAVLAEDYFGVGPSSAGNSVIGAERLSRLLPGAFVDGGWMPIPGAEASRDFALPVDPDPSRPFFDPSAAYRGAFDPSGEDWTLGWTEYPVR